QMPDGNTTVIIQGKQRFKITELVSSEPYLKAKVERVPEDRPKVSSKEFKALISSIKELALQIIQLSPNLPSEAGLAIKNIESPTFLVNFISSNMSLETEQKQSLLETKDFVKRAKLLLEHLTTEIQMLELKNQIQNKVRIDLDKQQRDYFLSQQLKTIQEELEETRLIWKWRSSKKGPARKSGPLRCRNLSTRRSRTSDVLIRRRQTTPYRSITSNCFLTWRGVSSQRTTLISTEPSRYWTATTMA